MRVYLIERNYQPAEMDLADLADRFILWLGDDSNPVLTDVIHRWLRKRSDAGGLGALAESVWDLALLRAEITASFRQADQQGHADVADNR